MRSISPATAALFASGRFELVQLVEMQLTSTLRLATSGINLEWGGFAWQGAAAIGSISESEQAAGEIKGVEFTLSAVPAANIAVAMSEPVQGKTCILRTVVADRDTWAITDVLEEDRLRLDVMRCSESSISQVGETIAAAITVVAESVAIDLLRARGLLYTDGHQQRLAPGDKGCEYVRNVDLDIVWPDRTYKA